jgi:hypothetical protein
VKEIIDAIRKELDAVEREAGLRDGKSAARGALLTVKADGLRKLLKRAEFIENLEEGGE